MPVKYFHHSMGMAIVHECCPYIYAAPWDFLKAPPEVLRLPDDPNAVLAALRSQWSDQELCAAKLVQPGEDGSLNLIPALNSPGQPIVIYYNVDQLLFDILTDAGYLFHSQVPALTEARFLARQPRDSNYQDGRTTVVAVCSMADVAVLQACGISATLVTGLDHLGPTELDQFAAVFGVESGSGPKKNVRGDPFSNQLLIAGWSPATLDPPPSAASAAIEEYFSTLLKLLHTRILNCRFWEPAQSGIDRIHFLVNFREVTKVREALLESLSVDIHGLEGDEPAGDPLRLQKPKDLPSALKLLQDLQYELLHYDPDSLLSVEQTEKLLKDATQGVLDMQYAQLIRPMLEEALQLPSPRHGVLAVLVAQLASLCLTNCLTLNTRLGRDILTAGFEELSPNLRDEIPQHLKTVNTFLGAYRELTRCLESTAQSVPGPATPRLSLRGWTGSN